MTESVFSIPHVYYPVTELSMVKDVRVMKNTKVKTIGYIYKKNKTILKETPDSSTCVGLDLTHVDNDVIEIYPYIIFGVLCTVNEAPVVAVKFVKRFESNGTDLNKYKEQCLLLRNRLSQYDDIMNLSKIHNWT